MLEIKVISSHKEMAKAMLDYCNRLTDTLFARHFIRFNVENRIIEILPYSFTTDFIPLEVLAEMVGKEVDYWEVGENARLATFKDGCLEVELTSGSPWYSYRSNFFLTTGIIGKAGNNNAIKGFDLKEVNEILLLFCASKHFKAVECNPLCLY